MRLPVKTVSYDKNLLAAKAEMLKNEKLNNEKMKEYFGSAFLTFHKAIANLLEGEYQVEKKNTLHCQTLHGCLCLSPPPFLSNKFGSHFNEDSRKAP